MGESGAPTLLELAEGNTGHGAIREPWSGPARSKTLRRRRDFARQRWPFGQHKIAVCRVAPTAAPRISRVHLPMAVPFGLGPRRGICLYHRRCGAISFRQTRAPFGPHSEEDLRW